MKETKITDEWLSQYLPIVDEALMRALEENTDYEYPFSDKFERRMERLMEEETHPRRSVLYKFSKQAAILFVCAIGCLFVTAMSIQAYRTKHFEVVGPTDEIRYESVREEGGSIEQSIERVMGLMLSMNVTSASDSKSATFSDGVTVHARSTITDTMGIGSTASTNDNLPVTTKIDATYSYVNLSSGDAVSVSLGEEVGGSSVSIVCSAPAGCRSVSMQCNHEAIYNGEPQSCSTWIIYP